MTAGAHSRLADQGVGALVGAGLLSGVNRAMTRKQQLNLGVRLVVEAGWARFLTPPRGA